MSTAPWPLFVLHWGAGGGHGTNGLYDPSQRGIPAASRILFSLSRLSVSYNTTLLCFKVRMLYSFLLLLLLREELSARKIIETSRRVGLATLEMASPIPKLFKERKILVVFLLLFSSRIPSPLVFPNYLRNLLLSV
jgi:hypothetical protein